MKSPALPNLPRCIFLTTVLLTAAGCGFLTKKHSSGIHGSQAAVPPPATTPSPAVTPVPGTPAPGTPASGAPGALAVASTPPPYPVLDKKFLDTASRILAYQRKLGALAKQYGNSDEARNLGSIMESEMALAGDGLKTLTASRKQQLGGGAGWGHGGLERLASQRGEGFDRKFYEEVKLSSPDSYGEFDRAFRTVADGGVKEFARNWYPVLRNYPREAIKLELKLDKKRK